MGYYIDDFEVDDWFESDQLLTWKQARAKNERKKREREKAERERHKARQKKLAPLQAHYDNLVQRCMDERRYFTPISYIWHSYYTDGGEGDIVYPEVEDLPFQDDVPDDDDEYWEHFWNSYEQISQGAKIDDVIQENVDVDFVEVEIKEFIEEIDVDEVAAGYIKQLKDLRATSTYFDPYSMYCSPLIFIIADMYAFFVPLSCGSLIMSYFVVLWKHGRKRFVFDPGGFEDESFSNREGMM